MTLARSDRDPAVRDPPRGRVCRRACSVGVGVPTCVPTRLTRSRTALAIEESPKIRNKLHRKVPRAMHNPHDNSGKRRNSKERAEI